MIPVFLLPTCVINQLILLRFMKAHVKEESSSKKQHFVDYYTCGAIVPF